MCKRLKHLFGVRSSTCIHFINNKNYEISVQICLNCVLCCFLNNFLKPKPKLNYFFRDFTTFSNSFHFQSSDRRVTLLVIFSTGTLPLKILFHDTNNRKMYKRQITPVPIYLKTKQKYTLKTRKPIFQAISTKNIPFFSKSH